MNTLGKRIKLIRIFSLLSIITLPLLSSAQFGHNDSKWLYRNEGPIDDCEFILMEIDGDSIVEFERDTISMTIINCNYLDSSLKIIESTRFFLWKDSLNGGSLLSFFEEKNGLIDRDDEVFTYAFGNKWKTQWHAPINNGFAVGLYDDFKILEEDTFWFNDSIFSKLMRFESTPKNNYMCETVIERIGSVGFMMAINKDKPDYRAGNLIWYFDSEIDTFFVPNTFNCNYTYTNIDRPNDNEISNKFFWSDNRLHFKDLSTGGTLFIHDINGKMLYNNRIEQENGIINIPFQKNGLLFINYFNDSSIERTIVIK